MHGGDIMAARLAIMVTAAILAAVGLSVADIPDLVGNWTGSYEGYEKDAGYVNVNETGALIMIISEQIGRVFTGNFTINVSSPDMALEQRTEGFSGIIARDNKTLYLSEYDTGYDIGTIISNDTIEFDYLENGENAGAYIDTFHRTK
jgi:hypothetical protein